MLKVKKAESGQAIVLIAILMIGLIAMLGLVIDAGGMFVLKRDTQNAVDAAALAAAYALCTNTADPVQSATEAAMRLVEANGFSRTTATITSPITHREVESPENYVRVSITAEKPAYFIQIVYRNPLLVTSSAVGVCNRDQNPPSIALAE
jgi:Flp pilus assembly protein TadG